MASAQLTDEELFSELKRLGFTPGPVTEHTRPVYLKKLKKLREEQSQQRGSRSGKGRNGGGSINNSNGGGAAARAPGLSARPPSSDVTRRSEKRGAADRPGKFVLGFSSDESDVEAPQKKGGASRRDRGAAIRPAGTSPTAPETPWWADRARSSQSPEDPERDSRVLNGNRAFYEPKPSKFPQDYSDSDEEEDEEESDRERPRERRPLSRHALAASSSSPPPHRGVWSPEKKPLDPASGKMGERNAAADDDTEPSGGGSASRVYPDGVDFGENHIRDDRDSFSSGYSRFALGLRPRFPSYANQPNHGSHAGSNHSHAAAAPEDELLQQFKRDDEVSSTGGLSAHYLSRILLTTACLFFVLLGLMYLRMRGSGAPQGAAAVIVNHPFGPEFDEQYDTKDRELILNLLFSLHEHLAGVAGSHDCEDSENPLNRSVSFSEAFTHLKLQNEAFENLFETSLEWIMKTKEAVGIRLIGSNPDEAIEDVSDISRLESIHPRMSFLCRFRRAFFTVIHRVLFIIAVICAAWGLGYYMKYRWRRQEEETRQMYDTVERIIDVMRSHSEACQENKDLQPYLPIPHVRDSLVQPQDRKKMKKVWDRAVRFLSANESRIRTETRRVGGADCTVWRWLQPTSPEKSSSVPSKVWQGKGAPERHTHTHFTTSIPVSVSSAAFPLDRRNSPPNSLTPCLKIRNMFDPVMEVGENWHLAIQEAILEKCSDNDGIVHIAVDKNSREGCVYVKCLSAEHSGKAFKSLHGSWFDGKLVTVKYLRLDRYHQRFPQALGSNTPLKPSSSSMNSMSRLNQRSTSLSFS